jgi:hypothetical protein
MKCKVTKTMCKELNKAIKDDYCIEKVYYIEYTAEEYKYYVNFQYLFDDYIWSDWRPEKNKFAVLLIEYKADCYAMPQYAATSDLQEIIRDCKEKTIDEFVEGFKRRYHI